MLWGRATQGAWPMEQAKSRSRVVTWDPQAGLVASRQLSGLEYLQKLVRGDLPVPPFARLLNIAFLEVSQGRAVFAIDPSEEHYNAVGTVHGGGTATLCDSALRLFSRSGFAGVSVEKVMRAAGLTVGGFYLHFGSKQRLVTESLRAMLSARRRRWLAGLELQTGEAFRRAFVRRYVEQDASSMNENACPMPALLSELTRARVAPRKALGTELSPLMDEVARRLGGEPARD